MSGEDIQLRFVNEDDSIEELRSKMKDNMIRLQTLISGLTGEEIKDWTPILRDGRTSMSASLEINAGQLYISSDPTSGINNGGFQRTLDGRLQWSANGTDWNDFVGGTGTELTTLTWDSGLRRASWIHRSSLISHTITTDTTLTSSNELVLIDATDNDVTITIPTTRYRVHLLKRIDDSMNTVSVVGASGTIDGSALKTIDTQYEIITIFCDGTNFWIL